MSLESFDLAHSSMHNSMSITIKDEKECSISHRKYKIVNNMTKKAWNVRKSNKNINHLGLDSNPRPSVYNRMNYALTTSAIKSDFRLAKKFKFINPIGLKTWSLPSSNWYQPFVLRHWSPGHNRIFHTFIPSNSGQIKTYHPFQKFL